MPLKIISPSTSQSQCSTDFRNFTKKLRIAFLTCIPLPGIFAATCKTGVRQDFFEDIVLPFSLFVQSPLQCSVSLDSNNKFMHFRQRIHQQYQKVNFIFIPIILSDPQNSSTRYLKIKLFLIERTLTSFNDYNI